MKITSSHSVKIICVYINFFLILLKENAVPNECMNTKIFLKFIVS